jgi:hypothetical protein
MCIELGALEARPIRLLEEEFWEGYPSRRVEQVLRLRDAGETGDWRTPWERGEDDMVLARYEREQFEQSVEYLQGLRR